MKPFHSSTSTKVYFYRWPGVSYPFCSVNLTAAPVDQWKSVAFVCTAKNILEADKLAEKYGFVPHKLLCSVETVFLPIIDASKLLWFLFFVKER